MPDRALRDMPDPGLLELETPHGPARAHLHRVGEPRGALVLGHGAGGGVGAPDLVRVTQVGLGEGFDVVLIEQPYRVAGRRSPAPAKQLDAAWLAVVAGLRDGPLGGLPLVTGGRSSGARVACRTAAATEAAAVLCLAFPLRPPGKPDAPTRQDELDAVAVRALVVQGESDAFGMPAGGPDRRIVAVPGNHSLRAGLDQAAEAVRDWLRELG